MASKCVLPVSVTSTASSIAAGLMRAVGSFDALGVTQPAARVARSPHLATRRAVLLDVFVAGEVAKG